MKRIGRAAVLEARGRKLRRRACLPQARAAGIIQGQAQAEHQPLAHLAHAGETARGREQVHAAALIVRAELAPVGTFRSMLPATHGAESRPRTTPAPVAADLPVYPASGGVAGSARARRHTRDHVHRAHDAGLAADAVRYAPRAAASPGAHGQRRRSAGEGRRQRPVPLRRRHDGSRRRGPALPQLGTALHARARGSRLGRGGRCRGEWLLARAAGDRGGHALGWQLRLLPRGARQ